MLSPNQDSDYHETKARNTNYSNCYPGSYQGLQRCEALARQ